MSAPPPPASSGVPSLPARRRLLALPLLGPGARWLGGLVSGQAMDGAQAAAPVAEALQRRALTFPRDHGAHPAQGIEWWYLTGWLQVDDADTARRQREAPPPATAEPQPALGFQLTFFRRLGPAPPEHPSPLAARQLLMAHAALTVLPGPARPWADLDSLARLAAAGGGHLSGQRIARASPSTGGASTQDTDVHIGPDARHAQAWRLQRLPADAPQGMANSVYEARFDVPGSHAAGTDGSPATSSTIALSLRLGAALPPLLQGEQGWSRKGPRPEHASHYLSEPQLHGHGQISQGGRQRRVSGRAWLDHEWSSSLLPEEAVGWDWLGINLFDGSALTLFRLRRQTAVDGASASGMDLALWAGGSWRSPDGSSRALAPGEIRMQALAHWTSPQSRAVYPVRWRLSTPLGEHQLVALLDDQEVDAQASTATRYWEGLAELRTLGEAGRRIGLGYLELTGYGGRPAL